MFNGKTHYKWPLSIAMLNYHRVHMVVSCECSCEIWVQWGLCNMLMDDAIEKTSCCWKNPHESPGLGLESSESFQNLWKQNWKKSAR